MTEATSILSLPLEERRYIAVVSDEEFAQRANVSVTDDATGSIWPILGFVGATLAPGGLLVRAGLIGLSAFLASRSNDSVNPNAVNPNKANAPDPAGKPGRRTGAIRIVRMGDVRELRVSSGSVEIGDVYAAHPLVPHHYYAVETYNDDLLEHKLSELERLLNALGAKRYAIKFEDQDDLIAKLAASAKKAVTAKAAAEYQRSRRRRFERSGTADGRDPVIPDGLVWFDREPAWQSLAESRLQHGRREFGLIVELENSLKISAQATADIKKIVSVDVGGKHERSSNLTLSVTGTF